MRKTEAVKRQQIFYKLSNTALNLFFMRSKVLMDMD
jgi:hypothetical protein